MAARHLILLQQQPELHALDPSQLVPALDRYDYGVVDRRFQRSKLEPEGSKPTARKEGERNQSQLRAHLFTSLLSNSTQTLDDGKGSWTHRASLPSLSTVQQHPVVDSILHLSSALERLREQLSKEVVIWRLLESEFPNVVEVDGELLCKGERKTMTNKVSEGRGTARDRD